MRRFTLTLVALVATMLVPLTALADDAQIAQEVVRRLEREKQAGSLQEFSLNLDVIEGSLVLNGHVANEQQRTLVLEIARRVPGVVQVVNGIEVQSAGTNPALQSMLQPGSLLSNLEGQGASVGSGRVQAEPVAMSSPRPVQVSQQQYQGPPQQMQGAPARPIHPGQQRQPQYLAEAYGGQGYGGQGYAGQQYAGTPVPMGASQVPAYMPSGGAGVAPARFDNPQLPAYAWPGYAAYPNYAALTYPQQYSPTAWPYIGPFYPYPQVPLGWRKVTLEWDDGWWFIDFCDKPSCCNR